MELSTDNVMDMSLDDIRKHCFSLVPTHESKNAMDVQEYTRLLGLYPAVYQYVSEMYVYLIAKVRSYTEAKNTFKKIAAMDRRDCLEQILKVIKFEYDGLSRKTTVLSMEAE